MLLAIGITVAVLAYALGGLFLVRRWLPSETRRLDNDVAASLTNLVGVVFAVLMAFIVVNVWQQFGAADVATGVAAPGQRATQRPGVGAARERPFGHAALRAGDRGAARGPPRADPRHQRRAGRAARAPPLVLYLIAAQAHPFRGDIAVGPDSFVQVRENLNRVDARERERPPVR